MKRCFNISFEPDRLVVLELIKQRVAGQEPGFIVVCDGNILSMVQRDEAYRAVIDKSMFAIVDSSWIPVYVKRKYGEKWSQYCGSDIFRDITDMKVFRQYFLGSSQQVLDGLRHQMSEVDLRIGGMIFEPLPFCSVEDFDYEGIAARINEDSPDIVWLSLGAPKQEQFAAKLLPYLNKGVIIPVGAVFDFRSGVSTRRAPQWLVKCHLEFVFRIFTEPRKQLKRCWSIISTLPLILR